MNMVHPQLLSNASIGPDGRPIFSEEEVEAIRDGVDGIKSMLPARCYHDEAIYHYEVEHVLKKNWLCVGRWDWAEKPGDYFTTRMFGESIVIARGKDNELRALINVCQHRWAQVVPEGSGNAKLFVCPFHGWTYDLDGRLRAVAARNIPGFDKSNCRMPSLRLEVWEGFVFINFDPEAAALAPQLAGLQEIIGRYQLGDYRSGARLDYDTNWNYKLSFETGYEAYHHEGCHQDLLGGTSHKYPPVAFGEIWGAYAGNAEDNRADYPFGTPDWFTSEDEGQFKERSVFIGIYPSFMIYLTTCQVTFLLTEYDTVAKNRATTANAFAAWTFDRPNAESLMKTFNERMSIVQNQDTSCCENLQKGLRSSFNKKSVVHPFEAQLSHFYQWMLGQYQK